MSTTRHAKEGSPLRQERYASDFHQGLLANLVAKRGTQIDAHEDRALIWFLQGLSWQKAEFEKAFCNISKSYPFDSPRELEEFCLDPTCLTTPRAFLAIAAYKASWCDSLPKLTETAVSRKVEEALEYTMEARCFTIIDGPARTGKTFAARAFSERSAGLVRYAQVPCSSDSISFFRAIAKALGVSSSLQLKAAELRQRIEEVLQQGDLMLLLDEAHYLFPQSWQRYAMPERANWLMTACVNYGVPVACITTPQFYTSQARVERLTGWTSEQFTGRIGHVERLPERLVKSDLQAVATALLPEADPPAWKALAAYADDSKRHLASIEAIAKRATWLASREGRSSAIAADVRAAMKESVIPSDTALAASLAPGPVVRRNGLARAPRARGGSMAEAPPYRRETSLIASSAELLPV